MRLLFIFIILLFQTIVFGQRLTKKQEKTIKETIQQQFGVTADEVDYNYGVGNYCIVEQDTFYNPDGYNYVFKLNTGNAERLDASSFHGSNFQRFLFSWEGKMYALGGYGFFTTNNNLSFFNPRLKGWAFKHTFGKVPNTILGLTFKLHNQLVSFNNYKSGNSATKNKLDSSLYVLDLPKMRWTKYRLLSENIQFIGRTFYLKNYVLFVGKTHSLLFKNNSLSYVQFVNEDIGLSEWSMINYIDGNSLYLLNNEHKSLDAIIYSIDFSSHWNKVKSKSTLRWEKIVSADSSSLFVTVLPWLLVLLVFVVSIRFVFVSKRKNTNHVQFEYSELHKRFINHPVKILTIEELDVLLGIDHLEADSKKLKRTRLINDLNLRHPNFIERRKDESDKRRFVYIVNIV